MAPFNPPRDENGKIVVDPPNGHPPASPAPTPVADDAPPFARRLAEAQRGAPVEEAPARRVDSRIVTALVVLLVLAAILATVLFRPHTPPPPPPAPTPVPAAQERAEVPLRLVSAPRRAARAERKEPVVLSPTMAPTPAPAVAEWVPPPPTPIPEPCTPERAVAHLRGDYGEVWSCVSAEHAEQLLAELEQNALATRQAWRQP